VTQDYLLERDVAILRNALVLVDCRRGLLPVDEGFLDLLER
jgi:hypothetical protein